MLGASHHISHEDKHTNNNKNTGSIWTRLCGGGEEKVWPGKIRTDKRGCARFIPRLILVSLILLFTAHHGLNNRMEFVLGVP